MATKIPMVDLVVALHFRAPPPGYGDYAFILHILASLNEKAAPVSYVRRVCSFAVNPKSKRKPANSTPTAIRRSNAARPMTNI